MDTKTILNEATGRMQKAIDHLEEELLNVRAGKASPNALNGVMVDYFGSQVPVSGAASVTVPDARTILIQPWDKNMLRPIEKAIIDSNIGLTPSNNGEQIRLTIPPLTEERRKELVKQVRAEAETALFQQSGQLLAAAELSGLLGIPDAAHLVQNEQRCVQMIQQGGRARIAQAVVFIHGFRHQAGVQLSKVGFRGLFQCGAVPTACLFDGGTQGLAGRGEVDFFQCAVPPLGQQVKGGHGVDLVVPVLHAGGLTHIRRVDIHDIAAHAELSRAVHLTAAHIPGGKQPRHQRLAVIHHAGLQGEGVLDEFCPGHGVLQKCLGGHADGLQPPARQCTQHRKAAILVFAPGTLHRAQHEVPGREHRRGKTQRLEVIRKVGGLGFARGHDAEHPAKVFLQGGIQQRPACGRQTEQRRRPG